MAAILKISNILDRFILTSDMERPPEINPREVLLMLMTSLITSQCDVKVQMEKGDGHRFSLLDKKPVHAILLIFKQVKHQYNLQYFSYHYHHYNEHYISKFWQVRNLRLPFHLSVCLFVCTVISQNLKNDSVNHQQTWSKASTSPWFLQVRWTKM